MSRTGRPTASLSPLGDSFCARFSAAHSSSALDRRARWASMAFNVRRYQLMRGGWSGHIPSRGTCCERAGRRPVRALSARSKSCSRSGSGGEHAAHSAAVDLACHPLAYLLASSSVIRFRTSSAPRGAGPSLTQRTSEILLSMANTNAPYDARMLRGRTSMPAAHSRPSVRCGCFEHPKRRSKSLADDEEAPDLFLVSQTTVVTEGCRLLAEVSWTNAPTQRGWAIRLPACRATPHRGGGH